MLIDCDGFNKYTSVADAVAVGWSTFSAFSATAGIFGDAAATVSSNTTVQSPFAVSYAQGTTLRVGFYLKATLAASAGAYGVLAALATIAGSSFLRANASGQLFAQSFGGVNLGTASTPVCDGNWHWVEVEVVWSTTTTGSFKVYQDGTLVISATGVATGTSTSTSFYLGTPQASATQYGALVLWDNTGSYFNTFPIGALRIPAINPNGAGSSAQFTPSAGANYAVAAQVYSATATLTSSTGGQLDEYTVSALGYTPSSILAVVTRVYAADPSATGTFSIAPVLKTSAGTLTGTLTVLGAGYKNYSMVRYVDSASAAFTAAALASAQIGMQD